MTVRNLWPGQAAEVVNGSSGATVVGSTTATNFSVPADRRVDLPGRASVLTVSTSLPFAQVTGSEPTDCQATWARCQSA